MKKQCLYLLILLLMGCNYSKENKTISGQVSIEELREATLEEIMEWENDVQEDLTLTYSREIDFPVDSTSRNFSIYSGYYQDNETGEEFFVNNNEFINSIDFYSIEKEALQHRVLIDKDEFTGLRNISGFYVANRDSIYVYSNNQLKMLLVDFKGNTLASYSFPATYANKLLTHMFSKFFVKDDVAIINYNSFLPAKFLADSLTGATIDLKTNEIKKIGAFFPKSYIDIGYAPTFYNSRFNRGQRNSIVTRLAALPLLFKYDIYSDSLKAFVVKSKYHTKVIEPWDVESERAYEYLKGDYYFTLYDEFRHVYYSVFSLELPIKDPSTGLLNDLEDKQMSIIITDTTFKYRGEVLLEKDIYFRNMVVIEDGLLISTASINNSTERENLMGFHLYKLDSL
ncbi:DUF4221 family protein [Marivirga lumbricoides]